MDRTEYNRTYWRKNKERLSEKAKEYRKRNKEKILIRYRAWHEKNREKINEKARTYNRKSKQLPEAFFCLICGKDTGSLRRKKYCSDKCSHDGFLLYLKDYRKKHPEKIKTWKKRKQRPTGIEFSEQKESRAKEYSSAYNKEYYKRNRERERIRKQIWYQNQQSR